MKERGSSGFQSQDSNILIPVSTAQKIMLGVKHINYIRVKINDAGNIDAASADIRLLLRDRHNISGTAADDFSVRTTKEAIAILKTVTDALKFFLAAIAGISLVVGGVGVMNIMLAAVNERVREIGLRKALGAKSSDIMTQFIFESVAITLTGGIVGIIIGIIISFIIALVARYLGYQWDLIVSPLSIIVGCGVAFAVGLIFGIYPASRAAKLNPIEALRYE
jgi:putative ABC transport system permease protein